MGFLIPSLQAQIVSVVSGSGFNIKAGTVIGAEGLDLTPAADFSITSSLSRSATVSNATAVAHINRSYQFETTTTPFSGAVQLNYLDSELNGLVATDLKMFHNDGSTWTIDNSSTNDPNAKFVRTLFSAKALNELSLSAACSGFAWLANDGTTDWNTADNWSCKITPTLSSDVVINAGSIQPLLSTDVAINSLTIASGAALTVPSGLDLTVTDFIHNDGSMIVEHDANLLQSGTTNENSGDITAKRINTSMRRLDYTYWSSPTVKADYSLKMFSPQTVSPPVGTSRFYALDETTNVFVSLDPTTTFFDSSNIARGFSIRAPNNFPTNGTFSTFNANFIGVPNSGDITIAATYSGTGKGFNSIGNPYPSTIDALAFLQYTPDSGATYPNAGTMYLWTRSSQGTSGSKYAAFNLSGGTAAQLGGAVPNGTIQVGQGFLLKKAASTTVVFNNAMRVGNNQGQYFRTTTTEKHRIWLNLATDTTPLSQMMVGYIEGTTLGFDDAYDGKMINEASSISSTIDDENYTIQARPTPFENTDQVPLHFKADTAANYTLSIDHVDGLFSGDQNIYLRDNLLGVTHDIKSNAYTFASEQGTFGNRFAVVYQSAPLGIEIPTFDANAVIVYKNDDKVLNINAGNVIMQNVKIYDVRGRLIHEQSNINATATALHNLKAEQQVLLVKITSDDNKVVTKKVVY